MFTDKVSPVIWPHFTRCWRNRQLWILFIYLQRFLSSASSSTMDTLQHKLSTITLIQAWDITESTPAPRGSLQSRSKIFHYCYYSSPGHLLTVSFNDNADTTQLTTRGTTTTTRSTLQYIPTLLTSPPSTPAPARVLSTITTLSGSSLTDHLSRNIPRGRVTNIWALWALWAVIKEISSNSLLMDHIGLFTQK